MEPVGKNNMQYQAKSFVFAFRGLAWFITKETKGWVHSTCAIAALLAGIILNISIIEWLFVIAAIGLVFVAEILNSCMEMLVDRLIKEQDVVAGRIKDLAAGAVLVAALTAMVIGIVVFVPYIIKFF